MFDIAISPTFASELAELLGFLSRPQKTQPDDFDPSPGSCGGGPVSKEDALEGVVLVAFEA